jgi:hypothetical protein
MKHLLSLVSWECPWIVRKRWVSLSWLGWKSIGILYESFCYFDDADDRNWICSSGSQKGFYYIEDGTEELQTSTMLYNPMLEVNPCSCSFSQSVVSWMFFTFFLRWMFCMVQWFLPWINFWAKFTIRLCWLSGGSQMLHPSNSSKKLHFYDYKGSTKPQPVSGLTLLVPIATVAVVS